MSSTNSLNSVTSSLNNVYITDVSPYTAQSGTVPRTLSNQSENTQTCIESLLMLETTPPTAKLRGEYMQAEIVRLIPLLAEAMKTIVSRWNEALELTNDAQRSLGRRMFYIPSLDTYALHMADHHMRFRLPNFPHIVVSNSICECAFNQKTKLPSTTSLSMPSLHPDPAPAAAPSSSSMAYVVYPYRENAQDMRLKKAAENGMLGVIKHVVKPDSNPNKPV